MTLPSLQPVVRLNIIPAGVCLIGIKHYGRVGTSLVDYQMVESIGYISEGQSPFVFGGRADGSDTGYRSSTNGPVCPIFKGKSAR
jgi:hypothetical protein